MAFKVPEKYRDLRYSSAEIGNNGLFEIPQKNLRDQIRVVASDGAGWEHVSVSKPYECPTWAEMCYVKSLFWDDPEDWAVQYHPPKSRYINNHQYCLHLWRPINCGEMPFPDTILVGIK